MGPPPGEEGGVATKPPAPATSVSTAADAATTPSTYLDWASSMQALYGGVGATPGNPPAFYPPSSSPSPYFWGNQSMTYGAPISYASFYPHGNVYAHSTMPLGADVTTKETEVRPLEGRGGGLKKTADGSLGNAASVNGNNGDGDKASSGSANADPSGNASLLNENCGGVDQATSGSVNVDPSQSDESGGEEFLKNSRDDEINPCDLSVTGKRSYDQLFPDLAVSAPAKVASSSPATNLSTGLDLCNSSHVNGGQNTVGIIPAGQATINRLKKAVPENQKIQDERERKKQKRKLSNRESARRSRERKQKECEDLSRQVAVLNAQNIDLRTEIDKLNMECKKLEAENTSIVDELKQLYGPSVLAATEGEKISMPAIQTATAQCNGHLTPVVYQNTS